MNKRTTIKGTIRAAWGLLGLVVFAMSGSAWAEDAAKPFLHPLFTDHMVLQRGMEDPVWGWTTPGAKVTVRMQDKTATATADASGKWMAKIGPFEAGVV